MGFPSRIVATESVGNGVQSSHPTGHIHPYVGIHLITRILDHVVLGSLKRLGDRADWLTARHLLKNSSEPPLEVQSIVENHITIPEGLHVTRRGGIKVGIYALRYNTLNPGPFASDLSDQVGYHPRCGRDPIWSRARWFS